MVSIDVSVKEHILTKCECCKITLLLYGFPLTSINLIVQL